MATLTEQMQDLAADIVNGHEERRAWFQAFRADADAERQDRKASVGSLKKEVKSIRRDNRAWVDSLADDVGAMLKEVRSDVEGARRAWHGLSHTVGGRPAEGRAAGKKGGLAKHGKAKRRG